MQTFGPGVPSPEAVGHPGSSALESINGGAWAGLFNGTSGHLNLPIVPVHPASAAAAC